jgi:hypothetical protein
MAITALRIRLKANQRFPQGPSGGSTMTSRRTGQLSGTFGCAAVLCLYSCGTLRPVGLLEQPQEAGDQHQAARADLDAFDFTATE